MSLTVTDSRHKPDPVVSPFRSSVTHTQSQSQSREASGSASASAAATKPPARVEQTFRKSVLSINTMQPHIAAVSDSTSSSLMSASNSSTIISVHSIIVS